MEQRFWPALSACAIGLAACFDSTGWPFGNLGAMVRILSVDDPPRRVGMSQSMVARVWRAFGLQRHKADTFKLSTNPAFIDKVRDIVGLYLAPPHRAVVLCVDEKPQIQALTGTAPVLPMRPGQPERRTHDYRRQGTTDLFAALAIQAGTVIGRCTRGRRSVEFRTLLDQIEAAVPDDLDVHLVLDNAATHKPS